jgi:hypothetical protein
MSETGERPSGGWFWYLDHVPQLLGDLTAHDFQGPVVVTFKDGSVFMTPHGFAQLERNATVWAVYTEHCGYHLFSRGSVEGVTTEEFSLFGEGYDQMEDELTKRFEELRFKISPERLRRAQLRAEIRLMLLEFIGDGVEAPETGEDISWLDRLADNVIARVAQDMHDYEITRAYARLREAGFTVLSTDEFLGLTPEDQEAVKRALKADAIARRVRKLPPEVDGD